MTPYTTVYRRRTSRTRKRQCKQVAVRDNKSDRKERVRIDRYMYSVQYIKIGKERREHIDRRMDIKTYGERENLNGLDA